METPNEKLKEILKDIDLDKHSKFSYQSSSSKTYKGRITWSLKEPELNVAGFGISKECELSIGSPDFCKMKLRFFLKGRTENSSNFVSLDAVFKEKLPNDSYFYSAISLIDKESDVLKSCIKTDHGKDVDVISFDDFVSTRQLGDFLNEGKKLTIVLFLKITCCIFVSHSDDAEYSVNDSYVVNLPTKKSIEKMPTDLKLLLHKEEEIHTNKAVLASALPALQMVCKAASDMKEIRIPKNQQNFNLSMFKKIMNFALTENIAFSNFADACRFYNAASTFEMHTLMDVSGVYLGGNLSKKNLFVVERLAHSSKNVSLLEACIDFVKGCDTEELANESMLG